MQATEYMAPAFVGVLQDAQKMRSFRYWFMAMLAHTIPLIFLEAKPKFALCSDIKYPQCSSHTFARATNIPFCCAAKVTHVMIKSRIASS